jgi:hypothetical protein
VPARYEVVEIESLDPYKEYTVLQTNVLAEAEDAVIQHGGRVVDTEEDVQWTPDGGWSVIQRRMYPATRPIKKGART